MANQSTKISYVDGEPDLLHIQKVELIVNPGAPDARKRHTLESETIIVGTGKDSDVELDDSTVSRSHCKIQSTSEGYIVTDLESTNGTYVDGVRVRSAFLSPKSVLAVGNTEIQFEPIEERVPIEPSSFHRLGDIVGRSEKIREVFGIIEKIAPTNSTVVIEGETGTGKEVVARTVHELSNRQEEPFVVFDCGAVPDNLIESELFGHEKGSFTGATMSREGVFQAADGGTIFLDELGELNLELQPKLLRVLEQREVRPVGANKPIPVDVRVIAATNRDLEQEVDAGRFREDLFYRLSVVRLFLPPLRERVEDIPLLVEHFLDAEDFNRDADDLQQLKGLSSDALEAMEAYDWPGNVRELLNVIERACSFAETSTIRAEDLPQHLLDNENPIKLDHPEDSAKERWAEVPEKEKLHEKPFKEAKSEWIANFEEDYIFDTLFRHDGNISAAARTADIDRKYFRELMNKHGIEPQDVEQ
jgi:DNA-binding NtrC family response regulator